MLVNLVGDREHIEFDAEIANQFQFGLSENLAGRIVRCVQNNRFGVLVEYVPQFAFIEGPFAIGRQSADAVLRIEAWLR